jgi:heptosyltransferase-2
MKFLIVQTGFLGDLILSTPLIERVLRVYPTAEIWLLVASRSKGLLEYDPRITGIIELSKSGARITETLQLIKVLRQHHFDCAITPHKSLRTALTLKLAGIPKIFGFAGRISALCYSHTRPFPKYLHAAEKNQCLADLLGGDTSVAPLALFSKPSSECSAETMALLGTKYVVVSPGSAWFTKMWPAERYSELIASLIRIGLKVVLVGSPAERKLTEEIAKSMPVLNLAGKMSLSELITLVANAQLLVCNDSMILHISSATRTPCVSVFCATTEAMGFGPWNNPLGRVVERLDLACKPCGRHGGNSCPTGTKACMMGVSADLVLQAVNGVLDEN